jgi:hypothetical protein
MGSLFIRKFKGLDIAMDKGTSMSCAITWLEGAKNSKNNKTFILSL